MTYEYKSFSRK